jgi:hypothetical protein
MPELLLMQSDATVMATNAQKDKNEADAESVRILKEKQKQNTKRNRKSSFAYG